MEYAARKAGAEGMSFATIIAAGARSALPHGRASSTAIPAGGFVVCDFGVILAWLLFGHDPHCVRGRRDGGSAPGL